MKHNHCKADEILANLGNPERMTEFIQEIREDVADLLRCREGTKRYKQAETLLKHHLGID